MSPLLYYFYYELNIHLAIFSSNFQLLCPHSLKNNVCYKPVQTQNIPKPSDI